MRLQPRTRKLLLVVHLVAAVGWLGADGVLLALSISGLRGADPLTVYPAGYLVGVWVIAPLALLTLVTGLLQGLLTPWGLIRHWWVTIKLGLTVLMTVLVVVSLTPGLREMAEAARTGTGPDQAERVQMVVPPSVACTLLIVTVVLSVYKPGGRVRRHRASARGPARAPGPASARVSASL